MGVSGLLRNVLKSYPSVHLPAPNSKVKVNYLFLDFNAFIYNTIHSFPKDIVYNFTKNTNSSKYEERLVELVILNTLDLVNNIVQPNKLLYIAIDGPPPLAKMVQQRERRYKNPWMQKLMKKHSPEKVVEGLTYDTNRITPGTRLMAMLNDKFTEAINAGKFGNISVVFDGSNIAGEAEHKYLKIIEEIAAAPDDIFVIFSGDGDAILLSLRFPDKKIYIMQGVANTALEDYYPPEQQFAYLDSDRLGNSIFEMFESEQKGGKKELTNAEKKLVNTLKSENVPKKEIKNELANFLQQQKKQFLMDFIFLSFLEGNDFAKPIYFLKFKEDRLRTPLGVYRFQRKIHNNDPKFRLVEYRDGQLYINQQFLSAIINRFAKIEEEKIGQMKQKLEKKMSYTPNKKENNALEHKLFTNQDHPLFPEFSKQFEQLFTYNNFAQFKEQYYKYFWGDYNIDTICKNYLNILLFNLRYYFGTGMYWQLNYDAVAAPLPSDLAAFLQKNPKYLDEVKLDESEPCHPFVVLAYVMPPQSMKTGILPKDYRDKLLKEYPQYFPEDIDMKLLVGSKLIYAEPHLLSPPISLLKDVLAKVKLTKDEEKRNELFKEPIVYIPSKNSSNNSKNKKEVANNSGNKKENVKNKNLKK